MVRLSRVTPKALILCRHVRAHAGIADQIPADEVGVAAVIRIAERALQRVRAHHREERGGAAREPGRRAGLDVDQHRILIGVESSVNGARRDDRQ